MALCEAAAPTTSASGTSLSLAEQLNVQCTDGTATEDCVPTCTADLHGYQLLLNIDGEDSKLSCELHHALYSWVGAATDGGYLGSDFQAFFSAVVSGAAGVYVGMLVEDAGISTALVVTPGQVVSVTGDPSLPQPPAWCVESHALLTSILFVVDDKIRCVLQGLRQLRGTGAWLVGPDAHRPRPLGHRRPEQRRFA